MRILQVPNASVPHLERIESLENIAKSILTKLESIEERIRTLEDARQKAVSPAVSPVVPSTPAPQTPETVPPQPPLTLDAEAVKKGLLTKMWKYLNDEQSERAV
jgi:hypothetical protein